METNYINTFWKTKTPCLMIEMYGGGVSYTPIEDSEYIPWVIISYADDYTLEFYKGSFDMYIISWLQSPYGVPVEQFHSCFEQVFITEEEYAKKVNDYLDGIRNGTIK